MTTVELVQQGDWAMLDLGGEMRVASWAQLRPGFVLTDKIGVLSDSQTVAGAELGHRADAVGLPHAPVLLAASPVDQVVRTESGQDTERVQALGFAGPSDGSITLILVVSQGMTRTAQLEALDLAAEARTRAFVSAGDPKSLRFARHTVAIAAPVGDLGTLTADQVLGKKLIEATQTACEAAAKNLLRLEHSVAAQVSS